MKVKSWKISRSTISEQNFAIAYQKRWERERSHGVASKFMPAPLLADYLYRGYLSESRILDELKTFQRYLTTLNQRKHINLRVGTLLSILQFIPHTASNTIEIRGNKKPKKVVDIFYDESGDVDWIAFSDGSTFPDKEFLDRGQGGGDWEGISTLFFRDADSAAKSLMLAMLNKPNGWQISKANLNEDVINTDTSTIRESDSQTRIGSIQYEVTNNYFC